MALAGRVMRCLTEASGNGGMGSAVRHEKPGTRSVGMLVWPVGSGRGSKVAIKERIIEADEMAALWLYRGNIASEKGDLEKAERHYERSQKWLDKLNRLLGNGDGTEKGRVK